MLYSEISKIRIAEFAGFPHTQCLITDIPHIYRTVFNYVGGALYKEYKRQIQKKMGRLQRIFGARNFVIVDNDKPAEDVNPMVHKRIRSLIDRAPTSYQAVRWIHRELEKRKRN